MEVSRLSLVYKKSPRHGRGSKDAVRYGGQSCWIGGCLSEPLGPQEQLLHFQVLEGVGHFLEALGNDSGNDEAHDEPADAHAIGE